MRLPIIPMLTMLVCPFFSPDGAAQEQSAREIEIHRNIKLIEIAASPDLPEEIVQQYQNFLPLLRDVLKENTKDQTDENNMTVRVEAGIKEVGRAKTKRPQALITAFCRNSRVEYVNNFILYSYANNSLVSKEETEQFIRKQILEPMECYAPTEPAHAAAQPGRGTAPSVGGPITDAQKDSDRVREPGPTEPGPPLQRRSGPETEIHKNVRLVEVPAGPDIPQDLAAQYESFLPVFREVLKENTTDQSDKSALVIRIEPGVREVGSAKTKRAQARVTGFIRNSRQEYFGSLLLYSYATNGPVSKEETERFLIKQILEPLECYAPPGKGNPPAKTIR